VPAPRIPRLVALLAAVLAAGLVAVGAAGALTAGSAAGPGVDAGPDRSAAGSSARAWSAPIGP
jgi:hypothetical protein